MRGFRAWHTKLGRYLTDDEFYVNPDGSVRSAFESYNDEILETDYIENFSRDDFDKGYIIREDDTGLKDKNGKEIYEGDIVKASGTLKTSGFGVGAIEMVQQQFIIMDALTYNDPKLGRVEWLGNYWENQLEVIGNIHENPELLEEKK